MTASIGSSKSFRFLTNQTVTTALTISSLNPTNVDRIKLFLKLKLSLEIGIPDREENRLLIVPAMKVLTSPPITTIRSNTKIGSGSTLSY